MKINLLKFVENGNGIGGDKFKDNKLFIDSNIGMLCRFSKIVDNIGKLVDEMKKCIGFGDIVFKNLFCVFVVCGEW